MNCYLCGSSKVRSTSVAIDMVGSRIDGVYFCEDCAKTGPALQDALHMVPLDIADKRSKCKYCYHFMNPLGRGCFTSGKAILAPTGKNEAYYRDHSEDAVCESFTLDKPGQHCMACVTHQPHMHIDAAVAAAEEVLANLRTLALQCGVEPAETCSLDS